jgi:phosphotransferase system HPr (HPr) family protein
LQEITVTVNNLVGLHARPAAVFVRTAAMFECEVIVSGNNRSVNGKSILGVLTLGIDHGQRITIRTNGPDEKEAIIELVQVLRLCEDDRTLQKLLKERARKA